MTAEEIVDELTYRSYRHNRLRGCGPTLAKLFANGEELERRFQMDEEEIRLRRLNQSHEIELERQSGCYEPKRMDDEYDADNGL